MVHHHDQKSRYWTHFLPSHPGPRVLEPASDPLFRVRQALAPLRGQPSMPWCSFVADTTLYTHITYALPRTVFQSKDFNEVDTFISPVNHLEGHKSF
jgi:hypothetical protein